MKSSPLALGLLALGLLAPSVRAGLTAGMQEGKVELKSISQLAFGPEGVLFIADPKAAAILAVATGDTAPASGSATLRAEAINEKIAALVGTKSDDVIIEDLAVNPISRRAYLAVSRGRGPDAVPLLVRVDVQGQPELVALDRVRFARAELPDAPADVAPAAGRKGGSPRTESITDLAYADGRVLVAGLSNEEFSSTLRAIPFPFSRVERGTVVENYHGAHGRFETRAPVRTFVPYRIGGEQHLLAAYTCTPLVQFALSELKPGARITGKTIAEFGNRNRPLDIIVYQKDGRDYLLMANSSRGVIKVAAEQITPAAKSITAKVSDTDGLKFEKIDWAGVAQLDRLDARHALVVRTGAGRALNLETMALP
ncbi:MAG: hypothetical protein HZC55_08415 [Verrucomicrobia bacterium]|nr:hypothetical protein [Verrucomicrobiota bacterium]